MTTKPPAESNVIGTRSAPNAGAPAPKAAAEPPALDAYPDKGEGLEVVTLVGLLAEPTQYRIGKPIPQDITVDGAIYNLSDRALATYSFRHR